MNWLGKIIQKEITKDDTVLDLGCGIMQATTNSLQQKLEKRWLFIKDQKEIECKSLLGCDIVDKYLDVAKKHFPVIHLEMDELHRFMDLSFDVVICIDVLEHLLKVQAYNTINEMKRIARKKIIVYTPSKEITNEEHVEDAWGLGYNELQLHKSFISSEELQSLGFKTSFPEPDKNTLGIFYV